MVYRRNNMAFILCLTTVAMCVSMAAANQLEQDLLDEAEGIFTYMQKIRRTVHAQPELMWEEEKTSAYIRQQLKELKIPFKHPVAKTGIVATIGSGKAPKIALRSDIDALPIKEAVDVPYKSKVDGKMHACGHDSHIAMLLGAAKLLKAREADLKGTVVLIFQPAEEGGAGAKFMAEEGALDGVQAAHGVHVMPYLPSGIITTKAGPLMAGATEFEIEILGSGGHGAMPHTTIDPVVAGAAVVNSLQHLISRVTNPVQGAVISVTRFNTGEGATNVIPDSVALGGTLRALDLKQFNDLRERIVQVAEAVAGAHGANITTKWRSIPYIPLINDAGMVDLVERTAKRFAPRATWMRLPVPNMAGEDFAFFAEIVPSAFTYLGIRNETLGSIHGLHTARFIVDETVLSRGAALHTAVALEFFNSHSSPGREEL